MNILISFLLPILSLVYSVYLLYPVPLTLLFFILTPSGSLRDFSALSPATAKVPILFRNMKLRLACLFLWLLGRKKISYLNWIIPLTPQPHTYWKAHKHQHCRCLSSLPPSKEYFSSDILPPASDFNQCRRHLPANTYVNICLYHQRFRPTFSGWRASIREELSPQ